MPVFVAEFSCTLKAPPSPATNTHVKGPVVRKRRLSLPTCQSLMEGRVVHHPEEISAVSNNWFLLNSLIFCLHMNILTRETKEWCAAVLFFFWGALNPRVWNQYTKWFVMNPSTTSKILQPHHWTLVVVMLFTSLSIKAVDKTNISICYISVPKCNASSEAGVDPGRVVWAAQPFPQPSSDPRDFCLHPHQPPLDPLTPPLKTILYKGQTSEHMHGGCDKRSMERTHTQTTHKTNITVQ